MLSRKFTLELCHTTLSFLCSNIAFLSQGMEIPRCEWNPFSSVWVIAAQSFICPISSWLMGTSRAGLCVWLSSRRRLLFTFPWHGSSMLHLEGHFPPYPMSDHCCLIWQILLFLGHGSINSGFKEEEFIRQWLWILVKVFDSRECWSKHQEPYFWRILNSL